MDPFLVSNDDISNKTFKRLVNFKWSMSNVSFECPYQSAKYSTTLKFIWQVQAIYCEKYFLGIILFLFLKDITKEGSLNATQITVESRMIFDNQAHQQMTCHFQLLLQCNVSTIMDFVRHTAPNEAHDE